MVSIETTNDWKTAHAGGIIGLIEISGVDNKTKSAELDQKKKEVESRLREKFVGFTRPDFMNLPIMKDYEAYYKRFDKTYHVQLQVESIVNKGKSLPNISPLVDSNFVAEVETLILTAGHDVDKLSAPLVIDVSKEGDEIIQMNGTSRVMRVGDMIMRDSGGVSCSIIYGQDNRSAISATTTHALYVAYAPPGIDADSVMLQLEGIKENVKLACPNAVVEQVRIIEA